MSETLIFDRIGTPRPPSTRSTMNVNLNEKEILAEFDRRHAQGVIFYDDKPRLQVKKEGGFTVRRGGTRGGNLANRRRAV